MALPLYDTDDNRAGKALAEYTEFEGMLGKFDADTMIAFMVMQHNAGTKGSVVEFGVYKGRSAAILANFQKPEEKLYLVDVAPYLDEDRMKKISMRYSFLQMDSAKFFKDGPRDLRRKSFRFVHADGSHTFDNVFSDMAVADKILAPDGIFVIDDYCNPNYPQVPAAVFTYLARKRTDLGVFLVGRNKCYICRRAHAKELHRFILSDLPDALESYGSPARVSKTDRNPLFDSFSLTLRPDTAPQEKFYGVNLYGHFYEQAK